MNPDLYQELVKQISSLQKRVDALIKPEVGRWIDWTPTVTQSGAVTVTVNVAKYIVQDDDSVDVYAEMTVTGSGTSGNAIVIGGIPAAVAPVGLLNNTLSVIGIVLVFGSTYYPGWIVTSTATTWFLLDTTTRNFIGASPAFGLAAGHTISLRATYKR